MKANVHLAAASGAASVEADPSLPRVCKTYCLCYSTGYDQMLHTVELAAPLDPVAFQLLTRRTY